MRILKFSLVIIGHMSKGKIALVESMKTYHDGIPQTINNKYGNKIIFHLISITISGNSVYIE